MDVRDLGDALGEAVMQREAGHALDDARRDPGVVEQVGDADAVVLRPEHHLARAARGLARPVELGWILAGEQTGDRLRGAGRDAPGAAELEPRGGELAERRHVLGLVAHEDVVPRAAIQDVIAA